jgi:hypothetical protein
LNARWFDCIQYFPLLGRILPQFSSVISAYDFQEKNGSDHSSMARCYYRGWHHAHGYLDLRVSLASITVTGCAVSNKLSKIAETLVCIGVRRALALLLHNKAGVSHSLREYYCVINTIWREQD